MSASTGTLVAAGLESAGYAGQSMVLSTLSPILIAGAVLIFVLLCAKSLMTMVTQGNYIEALKLLAYPMIVVFCLQTTTASSGAEWQFGDLKGDQKEMKAFVDNSVKANVSLPFELFNRFVSGMSQLGIGLILENPVSGTVLFSVRQQLLDSILKAELISPGLRSLVHEGLQGKCGSYMDAARRIARGNRDPMYQGQPDYINALSTYEDLSKTASIRLQTTGPAYTYVMDLLTAINSAGPARTEGEELVRTMCEGTNGVLHPIGGSAQNLVDNPINCSQVWCWSGLGLVIEARAALEDAVAQTVEQNSTYRGLAPESKAYILQQILKDIAKKVSPEENGLGLDPDASILPVVIAGYLLRKELGRGPRDGMYSEFAETSGVGVSAYQTRGSFTDSDKEILREANSEYSLTISAANQMMSFAYSLPYLQGILLFGLATLFPFFVITSAITRQGGGILFWAGAWIWLKSWDIGWAVIMLIDQLIWEFMPHRSIYIPVSIGVNSPITVMESAFDTDPTYSLATYYLLISMLLISIPTITGQLFLRGSQSMTQILFGGVQRHASNPSSKLEDRKRKATFDYHKSNADTSLLVMTEPSVLPRPTGANSGGNAVANGAMALTDNSASSSINVDPALNSRTSQSINSQIDRGTTPQRNNFPAIESRGG